ncbi:methylase involved in ubiquinone/menaquinone biosynthesis [Synechococcus sp. PCC 7502]|uniref:putative RNA methyltransferase n=1 Tax=Synechococcus sp. PCC 7502 TaxID=1173263 RepID=UPI00029FD21D|nr:methyltransferase domain-containing protein [Synechococcus sp. PCC 7502]AFY73256.1 methylase involved in ubiquinone/menaquinone biosynthesis [Synechococcus sp. PCC 7502]
MKVVTPNNLVCPIDGKELTPRNQSLICSKGHNFDIARQGYFNLLMVQHKASRDPGDTKEMVAARSRFLQTGCYEAIAQTIANLTEKHVSNLSDLNSITILDAGCGEGYYLNWLLTMAQKWKYPEVGILIGMDISKWAVQSAAKRNREITWIVGSNARPPFSPNSINLILCAFGFPSFDVFRRVLKPLGKIIMVDPAPNHLMELRQLIYPELKSKTSTVQTLPSKGFNGFNLVESYHLTYKAKVENSQAVQDLFLMTPHYFRSPPTAKTTIAALQELEFTVDVNFQVLAKA